MHPPQQRRENQEERRVPQAARVQPAHQEIEPRRRDAHPHCIRARVRRFIIDAFQREAGEDCEPARIGMNQTGGQQADEPQRQCHEQNRRQSVLDFRSPGDHGPNHRVVNRLRHLRHSVQRRMIGAVLDHEDGRHFVDPETGPERHQPQAHKTHHGHHRQSPLRESRNQMLFRTRRRDSRVPLLHPSRLVTGFTPC